MITFLPRLAGEDGFMWHDGLKVFTNLGLLTYFVIVTSLPSRWLPRYGRYLSNELS